MSQITSPGLNQRASDKFAPPPIEINPRVSVDNRFNEAGEAGTLAAAADNNWISSILSRQLDRASVKADPKFSLTVENLSDYMKGLPDEWADEFSDAGSDEEARIIRAQLRRRMSNMQTLQEAGWPGTAANFASNIVDPIAFGAGLLSGGAGWIEKGGRLTRLAKAGMLAAGGTLPITAYQESQDPDGSVANVLFNTAGAFAIGAAGQAVGEIATGKWAIKTMKEIEARDIAMLPPGATTEKAKIAYAEELSRNRLADAIDEESARLVSESDTHADDFTELAEAARKNEIEVIDVDAIEPLRTRDVEVEVPGTAKVSESDMLGAEIRKVESANHEMLASENRKRVIAEMTSAFSEEQANTIAPVMDAYARSWSKSTGKPADEFYSGLRVEKGGTPGEGALFSTVAWHGSPHKFDKFDIGKIGEGEGAQSFGHGLYFASSKDVADFYRKKLSSGEPSSFTNGKVTLSPEEARAEYFRPGNIVPGYGGYDKVLEYTPSTETRGWSVKVQGLDNSLNPAPGERPRIHFTEPNPNQLRMAMNTAGFEEMPKGRLYKVELAPDENQYLDWDKPLAEQSPEVIAAIEKMGGDEQQFGGYHPNDTGRSIYEDLSERLGSDKMFGPPGNQYGPSRVRSPEAASRAMKEAGIRGIKYLDGASRSKGTGNYNYVIFDDADVAIKEMFQRGASGNAQGSFELAASGQRVIRALANPDASTLPHEVAHDFLEHLPVIDGELAENAARALGAKDFASLEVSHKERFARGFEAYLRSGKAPSEQLKTVFQKFKEWLIDIYRSIKGSPLENQLNPKLKAIFDDMLTRGDVPGGGANTPPPPPGGGGNSTNLLPPGGNQLSTLVKKARDFIANPTDSMSAFGRVRWGMSGRLGQSPVPEVRMAASVYAQDSLARKGGEGAPYAATSWASREYRSHMAEVERQAKPHVKAFLERNNVPWHKRYQAELAFQKAVSWQLEGFPVGTVAPEVEAVANLHRQKYAELLDTLKRHGVPGFENIPEDPDYFPHLHNVGAVNAAIKDWGHAEVAKLYEMGLVKAGWDPVDAARVAPGFLDGILNLGHFSDLDKLKFFMGDAESLKAVFKRFNTGLSDADAERIAEFLRPKDAGLTPRARRRTDLDTRVKITRTSANGKAENLWLHQLMETNAQAVLHKYTRQGLGAAAEAEILRAMALKIDPSGTLAFKNFDAMQEHIIREYKAKGILTDRGPGKRDMDRLVALRKSAVGIPLHEAGIMSDLSRLARAYNFVRGSGTFGIAQSVELGKVVGEIGLEPVMQQMPAIREIWKRAQDGKLTNELLAELEEIIAVGTERITNQVTARFDDQLGIEEFAGGNKIEELARRGERIAGDASGLVPITIMQQRMAGAAASQKVLTLALSGRPMSARRLADIGLDQAMWDRIVDQVKTHSSSETGMLGRRLKRFNLDNWTDTEAAANLAASLDRWTRRVIQDSDVGSMALWMTHPAARLLVQFRTFTLQAWEKQFLRGVQVRDARVFTGWALTGALGALAYIGQQYVGALTDKEKAKKLKHNLSPKNVALQGFARSGASSILPSAIDSGLSVFKQEPLFDSRYSGLSSRGLMSNPSFELYDSTMQFGKGLGGLVTGNTMTRSEFKAGTRLLPFQNVLGIRNGLDAIADNFPKTAK